MKKNSLKQVACHEYKVDIAWIATQLSGAKPGKQGYITMFQAAINKVMDTLDDDETVRLEKIQVNWLSWGQPCELVKCKKTELHKILMIGQIGIRISDD